MTGALRAAAATAAIITAMWLQAALIGPLGVRIPVSLTLVLVACVAVSAGPTAGMCVGFTTGLLADLGSEHPVGLLALVWLVLGVTLGRCADSRRAWRESLALATGACVAASSAGSVLLALAAGDVSVPVAFVRGAAAGAVDGVLIAAVLPLVRAVLRQTGARFSRRAPVGQVWRHG